MKMFVSDISRADGEVAKQAMMELYAKDPIGYSYVMSEGSKKLSTTERIKVTAAVKEANADYTTKAVKYVDNLLEKANGNDLIAGKLLADESEKLGSTTLKNIVDTALDNGATRYSEALNGMEQMSKFTSENIGYINNPSISAVIICVGNSTLF